MKKVLVVDDAAFMRSSLKHILKGTDFEVIGEAEDGEDALEKYEVLSPDIVTMDITMPKMSGIDAVKKIMEMDKDATIIMISAMGQQDFVLESINAGAKNFIVKPFDKNKVIEVLDQL